MDWPQNDMIGSEEVVGMIFDLIVVFWLLLAVVVVDGVVCSQWLASLKGMIVLMYAWVDKKPCN